MGSRAVLDADVIVSAVLSPHGASFELLLLLEEGAFEAAWSEPLLNEIRRVLEDPKLRAKYLYTDEDVLLAIASIRRYGKRATIQGQTGLADDPGDDKVVETALRSRARFLVTFNTAHFARGKAKAALTKAGVKMLAPADFLQLLRGTPRPSRARRRRRR